MVIGIRYFDSHGDLISQQLIVDTGESPGWNGDLQNPVFVHRQTETFNAPPRSSSFWFVISSAGPPTTLGTIIVKGVVVTRLSANGSSDVVLRAPVGRNPRVTGSPVPSGFWKDGTSPGMARLLTLATTASNQNAECFAIIDNDSSAHAEWHIAKDAAPPVAEGERLVVEWNESYSIGYGGSSGRATGVLRPERMLFAFSESTLAGQPAGPESVLNIRVMLAWWRRPWVWAVAFVGAMASAVCVTRYIAHRRMHQQLALMNEERLIERERVRIARDIHDTLAQGFTGVIMQLEAARGRSVMVTPKTRWFVSIGPVNWPDAASEKPGGQYGHCALFPCAMENCWWR